MKSVVWHVAATCPGRPSHEGRGLKSLHRAHRRGHGRSPLTRGAWIEMVNDGITADDYRSPLTRGAWIEILRQYLTPFGQSSRRPSHEGRGLKSGDGGEADSNPGRPSHEGRGLK